MAVISLREYHNNLRALLRQGKTGQVAAHSRHILQHYPKNAETYKLYGQALVAAGQWQEAEAILNRVIGVYPDDDAAHYELYEVYNNQKRYDAALWHLERAYEMNPNNSKLMDKLQTLYREHRGKEIRKVPLTASAAARQFQRSGLYNQAISTIQSALERQPSRADLRLLLAETYWEADRTLDAAEVALQVLEQLPDCYAANRILVELWLMEDRPADAIPYLASMEQTDPYTTLELVQEEVIPDDTFSIEELDYERFAQRELVVTDDDFLGDLSMLGLELEADAPASASDVGDPSDFFAAAVPADWMGDSDGDPNAFGEDAGASEWDDLPAMQSGSGMTGLLAQLVDQAPDDDEADQLPLTAMQSGSGLTDLLGDEADQAPDNMRFDLDELDTADESDPLAIMDQPSGLTGILDDRPLDPLTAGGNPLEWMQTGDLKPTPKDDNDSLAWLGDDFIRDEDEEPPPSFDAAAAIEADIGGETFTTEDDNNPLAWLGDDFIRDDIELAETDEKDGDDEALDWLSEMSADDAVYLDPGEMQTGRLTYPATPHPADSAPLPWLDDQDDESALDDMLSVEILTGELSGDGIADDLDWLGDDPATTDDPVTTDENDTLNEMLNMESLVDDAADDDNLDWLAEYEEPEAPKLSGTDVIVDTDALAPDVPPDWLDEATVDDQHPPDDPSTLDWVEHDDGDDDVADLFASMSDADDGDDDVADLFASMSDADDGDDDVADLFASMSDADDGDDDVADLFASMSDADDGDDDMADLFAPTGDTPVSAGGGTGTLDWLRAMDTEDEGGLLLPDDDGFGDDDDSDTLWMAMEPTVTEDLAPGAEAWITGSADSDTAFDEQTDWNEITGGATGELDVEGEAAAIAEGQVPNWLAEASADPAIFEDDEADEALLDWMASSIPPEGKGEDEEEISMDNDLFADFDDDDDDDDVLGGDWLAEDDDDDNVLAASGVSADWLGGIGDEDTPDDLFGAAEDNTQDIHDVDDLFSDLNLDEEEPTLMSGSINRDWLRGIDTAGGGAAIFGGLDADSETDDLFRGEAAVSSDDADLFGSEESTLPESDMNPDWLSGIGDEDDSADDDIFGSLGVDDDNDPSDDLFAVSDEEDAEPALATSEVSADWLSGIGDEDDSADDDIFGSLGVDDDNDPSDDLFAGSDEESTLPESDVNPDWLSGIGDEDDSADDDIFGSLDLDSADDDGGLDDLFAAGDEEDAEPALATSEVSADWLGGIGDEDDSADDDIFGSLDLDSADDDDGLDDLFAVGDEEDAEPALATSEVSADWLGGIGDEDDSADDDIFGSLDLDSADDDELNDLFAVSDEEDAEPALATSEVSADWLGGIGDEDDSDDDLFGSLDAESESVGSEPDWLNNLGDTDTINQADEEPIEWMEDAPDTGQLEEERVDALASNSDDWFTSEDEGEVTDYFAPAPVDVDDNHDWLAGISEDSVDLFDEDDEAEEALALDDADPFASLGAEDEGEEDEEREFLTLDDLDSLPSDDAATFIFEEPSAIIADVNDADDEAQPDWLAAVGDSTEGDLFAEDNASVFDDAPLFADDDDAADFEPVALAADDDDAAFDFAPTEEPEDESVFGLVDVEEPEDESVFGLVDVEEPEDESIFELVDVEESEPEPEGGTDLSSAAVLTGGAAAAGLTAAALSQREPEPEPEPEPMPEPTPAPIAAQPPVEPAVPEVPPWLDFDPNDPFLIDEDDAILQEDGDVDREESDLTPAANAPDWLNAMVPGLDLNFSASGQDDATLDTEFIEGEAHRTRETTERPAADPTREFAWLLNVVEEESDGGAVPIRRRPRFVFTRPPLWLSRQQHDTSADNPPLGELAGEGNLTDTEPEWVDNFGGSSADDFSDPSFDPDDEFDDLDDFDDDLDDFDPDFDNDRF